MADQDETFEFPDDFGNDFGNFSEPQCAPAEPYEFERLLIVIGFGTPIAVVGIPANYILALIMLRLSRIERNSQEGYVRIYLFVLSICDMLTCIIYILLFTIDAFAIKLQSQVERAVFKNNNVLHVLWDMWHSYVMILFSMSKTIQFISRYLMLAATLDRFFAMKYSNACQRQMERSVRLEENFMKKRIRVPKPMYTITVCIIIIALGITLRMPAFWEYNVIKNELCPEAFQNYMFIPVLAAYNFYRETYEFMIMTAIGHYLPFLGLVVFNVAVIVQLRHDLRTRFQLMHMKRRWSRGSIPSINEANFRKLSMMVTYTTMRNRLNAASYSTLAVTVAFLVCGCLDVGIKMLEMLAPIPILKNEHGESTHLYRILTDVVSLLFVFSSCTKLFLCRCFDSQVKLQLHNLCKRRHVPVVSTGNLEESQNKEQTTLLRSRKFGSYRPHYAIAHLATPEEDLVLSSTVVSTAKTNHDPYLTNGTMQQYRNPSSSSLPTTQRNATTKLNELWKVRQQHSMYQIIKSPDPYERAYANWKRGYEKVIQLKYTVQATSTSAQVYDA